MENTLKNESQNNEKHNFEAYFTTSRHVNTSLIIIEVMASNNDVLLQNVVWGTFCDIGQHV